MDAIPLLHEEIVKRQRYLEAAQKDIGRYAERVREALDQIAQFPTHQTPYAEVRSGMSGMESYLADAATYAREIAALKDAITILESHQTDKE